MADGAEHHGDAAPAAAAEHASRPAPVPVLAPVEAPAPAAGGPAVGKVTHGKFMGRPSVTLEAFDDIKRVFFLEEVHKGTNTGLFPGLLVKVRACRRRRASTRCPNPPPHTHTLTRTPPAGVHQHW